RVVGDDARVHCEAGAVVVNTAAGRVAAFAAYAAVATNGRVVGDGAVLHGHGRANFAEEAAALTFAAVGQSAAVAADRKVAGEGDIGEFVSSLLVLNGPAPGVAAFVAVATRCGDSMVAGESAVGHRDVEGAAIASTADRAA